MLFATLISTPWKVTIPKVSSLVFWVTKVLVLSKVLVKELLQLSLVILLSPVTLLNVENSLVSTATAKTPISALKSELSKVRV